MRLFLVLVAFPIAMVGECLAWSAQMSFQITQPNFRTTQMSFQVTQMSYPERSDEHSDH